MSEAEKNQELHRLAALAAQFVLKWVPEWPGGGCLMRRVVPEPEPPFSKWVPWSPLNDDGDALRLAVDLGLEIYHSIDDGAWTVFVGYPSDKQRIVYVAEPWGSDQFAATRRAITRAAAEIGLQIMKGTPRK